LIAARAGLRVWVATRPIDFRRGVHGLVALVAQALSADPYGGDIFVFRSKRNDRIKLLAWDGSGIVLATKWLEHGCFAWPPIADGAICLSSTQLALLLDGLAWSQAVPPVVNRPVLAG
jgi:transposase